MYFRIKNNEEKYNAYIDERRKQNEENRDAVKKHLGIDFKFCFASKGFNCLRTINTIVLPEGVEMPEGWKESVKCKGSIEPNVRTKKGREDRDFIQGLPNWAFTREMELLGVNSEECFGRFSFPYIERWGDNILGFLDDQFKSDCEDDFEVISKSQFEELSKKQ